MDDNEEKVVIPLPRDCIIEVRSGVGKNPALRILNDTGAVS